MMNLLLVNQRHAARIIELNRPAIILSLVLVVGLCFSVVFALGYQHGKLMESKRTHQWQDTLKENRSYASALFENTIHEIDALALNLGKMEARSLRLDALGSRLVEMAGLDEKEFDFKEPPAQGGLFDASSSWSTSNRLPELLERFSQLQRQIDDRGNKLRLLESIMMDWELVDRAIPTGRPVNSGWISSRYGKRYDPFTGKMAWHAGIDFSNQYGSDIFSIASGVVTYSGVKSGYGKVIEVSHGNGYLTRYAHNSANLAKVGDAVEKGQVIAKMGSSGRSTGPHVHLEVLRDGKPVNPSRYIQ